MRYTTQVFCLFACSAGAQEVDTLALARKAAAQYGASLPDYVCQESMTRYNISGSNFRSLPRLADRVQAEVVNEQGKESFRNLRVNGHPAEKASGGIWSIGVFGPLMASLFEARVGSEFHRRGEGKEAGRKVTRYDFDVAEAKSNWVVTTEAGKANPAYHGSIWVETSTGRVLRHEIETAPIRQPFYYEKASLKVRYRFARINGTEYLLPSTMEGELCPRGYIYCDRVEATYSGCHKFSAESSLIFDEEIMGISRGLMLMLLAALCLAQDDTGGPPKLKRGRPEGAKQTTSTSQTAGETVSAVPAANKGEAPANTPEAPQAPPAEPVDPFLQKARQAAASFVDGLPNFLCQEMMTRYQSDTRPVNWRVLDTLSMDLVYEDRKEDYRNIKINGKATNKSLEESGGAYSTGDFGSMLGALFHEATEADFRSAGSDRIEGKDAVRYSLAVQQDRSGWDVTADKEKITVAYKGTVWLERDTGRALRLEYQAERIPKDFAYSAVEWTVNYAYTRVGGSEYLLPSRSETLTCYRGSRACSRNVIEFRNYRRFGGNSTITFDQ